MLSERLNTILKQVPKGAQVADVGTDHAYLPIELIKEGIAKSVIATDINVGPLETAKKNVAEAQVSGITLRLCDGLKAVEPCEVDTVIIAGMGGDNIIHIIEDAAWLKQKGKILILQPMSSQDDLRRYFAKVGFEIEKEVVVADSGKVYSVMKVNYTAKTHEIDLFDAFVGKAHLSGTEESKKYLTAVRSSLSKRAEGIRCIRERQNEREELLVAIEKITKILGE